MHHAKGSEPRMIFRHHVALILMVAVLFLPLPSPAQGPVSAKSGEPQRLQFDIPAQDLATGLVEYSDTTKIDLLVDSDLTTSLQTMGVAGEHTSEEALQKMLVGTGLTYRFIDSKTVTLTRDASSNIVPGVVGAAGAAALTQAAGSEHAQGAGNDTAQKPVVQNGHKPVKVPEILVKDVRERETAELDNLPEEYAGGDVARGGRAGILGNRDIMDTPFTQMNYTSKLIQDQQARFFADVLKNDPSIQIAQTSAVGFTDFAVRGFFTDSGDVLFNSLAIAPTKNGTMMTESIERVEVLRGPNALLNGAAPGGSIGGMVNLIPKRAGDEALTQLTAQYMSDSQVGGHVDIGRRFGSHKQFGVRVNGVYRNGDLPINHSSRESALATVGLDYRGDIVRLSADFGYQEQEILGARRQFAVGSGVTTLPDPPDTRTNANAPWELNHSRALYGTVRGEVDVTKYLTAFADFGITQDRRQSIFVNRQISDFQGTLPAANNFLSAFGNQVITFNTGLRGVFDTGPIHHQAVAAYTQYSLEAQRSPFATFAMPASSIYNPVFAPAPPSSLLPGYGSLGKINETNLASGMLGDTLSVLDGRVQLTGGVRFQQIKVTNFDQATGAVTSEYDKSAPTPMIGLLVKPWQHVSLYGNYIEGLQQGPTAPANAANVGEVFAPFKSKGYEAGVKVDFGRIATTLAAFQITQPSAFINPANNVFGVDGEQRNRGVEFMVFGEVMEGLRLLGGTTYIDAEITKTQGGVNQGNKARVLPFKMVLYGEWDLPFLKALTLTSRVTHGSSQYLNLANTQKVSEWTQWDLGARYRFEGPHGKPIMIRAFLENVLNDKAWYGTTFGQLIVRDPRTVMLSATFDF